jgi:uncharacterized protein with PhoU and TrkA domain
MSDRFLMDCAQSALMYSEEDARIIADAAEEITRLRARVDALRWPLAVYIYAHASGSNVPPHIEAAARAALEAKP